MGNFHPLEVVGRGSDTHLQVIFFFNVALGGGGGVNTRSSNLKFGCKQCFEYNQIMRRFVSLFMKL